MKQRTTLPVIALLGAALGGFALVSPTTFAGTAPSQEEQVKPQEKPKAEASGKKLHDSMELLEKSMRSLRSQMTKPEMKDEALATCAEMEKHILAGLQHVPAPHSELVDQTELEYKVEFKRRMLTVYTTVLDLEVALEKGDSDAAKTAFRSLGTDRRDGHQMFIPEEKQRRNRRGRRGQDGRGRGNGGGGGGGGGDDGGDKGGDDK